MEATGPAIAIDAFEGPMDLLLHLVRVHEVDIHDIPVALIAERYMAAIADLSTIDIDTAGEFLVMAATLAEIKSRVVAAENLSPEDAERAKREHARADKEPEDPRAELVRQLLEYKRLRERADALEQRLEIWQSRARVAPALRPVRDAEEEAEPALDLEDLTLGDLVEAFERIASAIQFDRLGEHQVTDDDTPIELHQADAVDRLERAHADTGKAELPLRDLFNGRTRPEAIGMFLAILELVRNLRVRAWRGESTDGEPNAIWLGLVETALED
ncbi:MAG: segregation/condensation protein A [Phycisphaerales bacterium]|nr:segregation/condensation protein A [Phycisphaerales bacterium]